MAAEEPWRVVSMADCLEGGGTEEEAIAFFAQMQRRGVIADLEIGVGSDAGFVRFHDGPRRKLNAREGSC